MKDFGGNKSWQQCSDWVQEQNFVNVPMESYNDFPDDYRDPRSDPLEESCSADESNSYYSLRLRRSKRNFSKDNDHSEVSQESPKHQKRPRLRKTQEETEVDSSLASDELTDVTLRKPLNLKDEIMNLGCGWKGCNFVSTNVEAFVKHVSNHVPQIDVKCNEEDGEEVYACLWESCHFETPNAEEVTRHVNFHSYHTKVKHVGALICKSWKLPECTFSAAGVNLVPDLPDPLECHWNDCGFICNNPNTFYGHVSMHGLEIPACKERHPRNSSVQKFKCLWKDCKTEVPHRAGMLSHLKRHSKERIAACPTCGALYSSRVRLIDHIKRQASVESLTYQCTHCSRSYPSERILRDHMRHHVNHHKCQYCDMTCFSISALSNHIRYRHIDEKPFACQYCDYRAKVQYNLRRHEAIHSASNSYFCEDCDFSCRTLNILNWHYRKKHESSPVYCCHMCNSRFARGAYLTQHLMRKHNFRWPSGHTRFRFYRNHDDGLFRLQTIRYESLDVVEDINKGEEGQESILNTDMKFKIKKVPCSEGNAAANFVVEEDGENTADPECDNPDDPDEICEEREAPKKVLDMPNLGNQSTPRKMKVLISIDEVDADGNVISSKTVEADELVNVEEMENALFVNDGECLLKTEV